jgi:tetrapyrrole methylase family protein/MazG family protein
MSDVKISAIKEELMSKSEYRFDDLVKIMQVLRSEEGCPWDREQDHKSIRSNFIEETYEVIEAIDTDDPKLLREELGDVMLQVVFHARMEEELGVFGIDDVCSDICKKLIHRHPHVFGTLEVSDSKEVLDVWNAVKNDEKQRVTVTDKLKAIPPMLPALMRAEKVGKKAKCFDFTDVESVRAKLDEELCEVDAAIAKQDHAEIEEEIGDLLLTVTSLCRKLDIDSELALSKATEKFISRFETLEKAAISRGVDVNTATMVELDKIWDEIKHKNI